MDCRQISEHELAEKYVSGQLDAELQDRLEVHLLDCSECLSRVETLMSVRSSLAEQAHEIRRFSTTSGRRFSLIWTLAASLLVAGALVSYFVERSRNHRQPGTAATQSPPVFPKPPHVNRDGQAGATISGTSANEGLHAHAGTGPTAHQKQTKDTEASIAPQPMPDSGMNPRKQKDEPPPTVASAGGKPGKSPEPIREETAVELYKVGLVDPPAYTFAGFGGSGRPPKNQGNVDTVISPGVSSTQGRILFQRAMAAYVEGHYADAGATLENILSFEPAAPDANFYLGVCRIVNGHPADSVLPLKKTLTAPASPLTQSAHFYLAKAYVQMQKLDEAEIEMQAAAAAPGRIAAAARALLPRIQALRKILAEHNKQVDAPQE